jgi:PAS domain S-box-containing protein
VEKKQRATSALERMNGSGDVLADAGRYRRLVELSPDVLYLYSVTRGGLYYSPGARSLFGKSIDDLYSDPYAWRNAVHPDDAPIVTQAVDLARSGQAFDIEYRLRDARGQWRWIHDRSLQVTSDDGDILIEGLAVDITERRLMAERLSASDRDYRSLFEHSLDAILVFDRSAWSLLECNAAARAMLGWREDELRHLSIGDALGRDGNRAAEALMQLDNDGCFIGELQLVRRDGRPLDADLTSFVTLRNRDGKQAVVVVVRDVSERKAADLQRRQTLAQLEKLASHVPGMVYQFQQWPDGRARFPFASQGIRDIYGIDPAAAAIDAVQVLSLIHADDLERVLASIDESSRNLTLWQQSFRVHHPVGSTLWLEGEASPERQPDGSTIWHGYISDVTHRKNSEERLEQLSLAVEQSPESIVITDLEARIVYVNDAFIRKTGYGSEEAIGSNPRMLQSGRTPPSTYEAMWAAVTAGSLWSGELFNRRKDGTEYVERASISPLRRSDGRISHYVSVKEDVTEKKLVEDELARHRLHLEQLVEERTRELAFARDEAQGANLQKSAFLANMSHEIRTPLNAMIGFTDVVLSGAAGPLNGEQSKQLAMVSSASRHLLALINDVLDISKIEAGQLLVECRPLNLSDVVHHAVETLRQAAGVKSLTLAVDLPAQPICALGDQRRVYQVLINLLSNAIKFTECGVVTVRGRRCGTQVEITVTDTGVGISFEDQMRLFQPFQQVGQVPTKRHDGIGLGLAISRRLIELQGGSVWVASKPDAGSTFGFALPSADSA